MSKEINNIEVVDIELVVESEFEKLTKDYMNHCGYSEKEAKEAATNTLIHENNG